MDILTVCAGSDLINIELCIKALKVHTKVENIYVVTNDVSQVPEIENVFAIDECDIIPRDDILKIKNTIAPYFPERSGWYLQQFLKMAFVNSQYCKGNYLIWDADTIILKDILFDSERTSFTLGKEKLNMDYANTYRSIFSEDFIFHSSMISQQIYVKKAVMKELIEEIESRTKLLFYFGILNNLKGSSPSLFSEYETYANYYANRYPNDYIISERFWFRNAAAICGFNPTYLELKAVFPECDYVALEKFDTSHVGKIKGYIRFIKMKVSNIFMS